MSEATPSNSAVKLSLSDIRKQFETLGLAESFFTSAVLFALHELGIFEALDGQGRSLDELVSHTQGDRDTLEAVLDAAVALDLLRRDVALYEADEALLDCLARPDSPAYMGEWIPFLHALTGPLLRLAEAVRTGQPTGALFEQMGGDRLPAQRMTLAMDAYARTRGVEMVDRLDFTGVESFLDLGCGPGTYSLALLERYPQVRATLLDLDLPIAEAREIVAARGMTERVDFVVADALQFSPEHGFDAVLISNTLHTLGPELSRQLLERSRSYVNPGGRLIVQAQFLNDDRTSPRWPTLLSVIQRATTHTGRNHSIGETIEWMESAGFTDIEHVRFSAWNTNSALVGRRA